MGLGERFFNLFDGLRRAHGFYRVGGAPDERGKLEGQRYTVIEGKKHTPSSPLGQPVTAELWDKHLAGEYGLGIVPIRDDHTVRFAAGDIDIYQGFSVKDLSRKVYDANLPITVCRTKSGGAHCIVFFNESVPAHFARATMKAWMDALGFRGIEIFPKQDRLDEEGQGNWINMPYQAGDKTKRYAIVNGQPLTTIQFLEHAEATRISLAELQSIEAYESPDWIGAPPCLLALSAKGFPTGSRNNALFDIGAYLRKRYPTEENLFERLNYYNNRYFNPVKSLAEIQGVAKSFAKKAYGYKCKEDPIKALCNKAECVTCEFGVDGRASDPGLELGVLKKMKTDPPVWIWIINGVPIELSTSEFTDQRAFGSKVLEALDKIIPTIKPAVWVRIREEALTAIEHIEVPEDATKQGQVIIHLHRFTTSRVQAKSIDELLMGKPFTDNGRSYFCATDFLQYLQTHRVAGVTEKDLFRQLQSLDVGSHTQTIKGKRLIYWSVPQFTEQTEEHATPNFEEGVPF